MVVDSLSATLAALSDPTRRSILSRLAAGPATVGELAGPFRMSQQAVSKHLAYLERARLVKKRREGRSHVCMLRPVPFKEVADWVEHYRVFWEERFDRLEKYLRELEARRASMAAGKAVNWVDAFSPGSVVARQPQNLACPFAFAAPALDFRSSRAGRPREPFQRGQEQGRDPYL
jgi:DNA-binding transcriptional ArsR family regulator